VDALVSPLPGSAFETTLFVSPTLTPASNAGNTLDTPLTFLL
jgi:hypothetical protein